MRIVHALAIASTLFGYCGDGSEAPTLPEHAAVVASEAKPAEDRRTVYVFTDFECPYCKKHDAAIRALASRRPDVNVQLRHHPLPMHPEARLAAKAAIAAEMQGKGDAYARLLFDHQNALSRSDLVAYAKRIDCDVDELVADMDGPVAEERLAHDEKLARELAIRGTPTSVVGVHVVEGAQPIAEIEQYLQ